MHFNKKQTLEKLQTALNELDDVNEFGTTTMHQDKQLTALERHLEPVVNNYLSEQKKVASKMKAEQKKDDNTNMNIFLNNRGPYGYNQLFNMMFPKLTKKQLGKQVLHNYEKENQNKLNILINHVADSNLVGWKKAATVNAIKDGAFIPKGTFHGIKNEIAFLNTNMRNEYLADDNYNAVCTKAALDYLKNQLRQHATMQFTN